MQIKATFKSLLAASSIAAGLVLAAPAHAAVVLGGSAMLAAGDDSLDFHAAVDGQGRTFVVMSGTDTFTGRSAIFGGFNPHSGST
jgi:hypothetical protein